MVYGLLVYWFIGLLIYGLLVYRLWFIGLQFMVYGLFVYWLLGLWFISKTGEIFNPKFSLLLNGNRIFCLIIL